MEVNQENEADQFLYSNQLDQLTYNADKIIQLSGQCDNLLKKFSYSYYGKDSNQIINKNLTAYMYWVVLDSLYFVQNTNYEFDRLMYIRKKKNSNRGYLKLSTQSFQDQIFINKMRGLAMKHFKNYNLSQIRQTQIIKIIELLEGKSKYNSEEIDQKINQYTNLAVKEKSKIINRLKQLQVQPEENASPLLIYYKFQKEMIRNMIQDFQKKKNGPKCQVCGKTDKIIQCSKCELKIHPICYPKLLKYYTESSFVCQNCQKGLNGHTDCVFCPIKGGHFLQVEDQWTYRNIFKLQRTQSSLKLKVIQRQNPTKAKFIHLSCSLWHPQLQYNIAKGKIQNIHRVDRKKSQNGCYQCGTNIGVTIPCANQNCRRYYHPQCAKKIDLSTCIINAKNKLLIELYCERHKRPYIYEILKENILNNFKQLKKFYEGIDHQLKRITGAVFTQKKVFNKICQQHERYDICPYCRQCHSNFQQKITNCWKCYNWYHDKCGDKCGVCS